ncbi:MAG: hypothetical protein IT395_01445, partial [Candidatus Omnitrophica bacterium]|nr:hypothetical protein [Candidatus Omnitrophota bacterium]
MKKRILGNGSVLALVPVIFILIASVAGAQTPPAKAPANPPAKTPGQTPAPQRKPAPSNPPNSATPAVPSAPMTASDQLLIPNQADPLPITTDEPTVPLEERMLRKITLDVRDMSVIDVLRFLALKGDFNLVTSSVVQGRATFYLKSVTIKDALNIAVLSNKLAFAIDNDIVNVMTEEEFTTQYGKTFSDKREVEIVHLQY